jgi:farnesyl-diphosphate farnesyltransferase
MAETSKVLLTRLLKDVSRSFYLTLRVLPGSIRPQIGLAYLLARTTDTVADTDIVPVEQRLRLLHALGQSIAGTGAPPLDLDTCAPYQGSPAERILLEQFPSSLALLHTLSPPDQQRIRTLLGTIISGQELDLHRFSQASAQAIVALRTPQELDDYTYRVAGCVGEFWTRLCRAHLLPKTDAENARFLAAGVRFGKGLQLVNILRDLPADLRKGRCYLPGERLAAIGLAPADLLEVTNEPRLRPLYREHLDQAEAHLAAGWSYTNTLPWRQARVRLACAWPVLIGAETIARLRRANVLDAGQRVKITRHDVRLILLRSVLLYPWPAAWRGLFPDPIPRKAVA